MLRKLRTTLVILSRVSASITSNTTKSFAYKSIHLSSTNSSQKSPKKAKMLNKMRLCKFLLQSYKITVSQHNLFSTQSPLFAGHSKWANIRHIKAQKDGQKATTFTKLSRQLRMAIQEGGSSDATLNTQLRNVMDEALRKKMPMVSIQNNIKKSQLTKQQMKRYRLELRYKQKVFAICILYTDNFPGVKMELGTILRKSGATYMDVGHMFDDYGLIEAKSLEPGNSFNDRAYKDAIDCGAEDVDILNEETGEVNFICKPTELNQVRKLVEACGYDIELVEHIYSAKNYVQLTAEEHKAYRLFVQKLRSIPGIEDIYDNVELDENEVN